MIGQWKEKAELQVLERGRRRTEERKGGGRERRREEEMKMEKTHVAWRSPE